MILFNWWKCFSFPIMHLSYTSIAFGNVGNATNIVQLAKTAVNSQMEQISLWIRVTVNIQSRISFMMIIRFWVVRTENLKHKSKLLLNYSCVMIVINPPIWNKFGPNVVCLNVLLKNTKNSSNWKHEKTSKSAFLEFIWT